MRAPAAGVPRETDGRLMPPLPTSHLEAVRRTAHHVTGDAR